ncbi:MAG: molecular chaperone TorD family protein [Gemmatimonadetes bacterium]|nr:molecular chaperone TorD family protein [Gemmatimonadota bacterium]
MNTSRADLIRTLGTLAEEPRPEHTRLAAALGLPGVPDAGGFTDLFALNLYPYASVHLGPEGMLGGVARDRVAGFWSALGLLPPAEPDHLGTLLGLLAELAERHERETEPAARVLLSRARAALVQEHLETWLPAFLGRVTEVGGPFYAAWARLLMEALAEEAASARALPEIDGKPTESPLPLHLRNVAPLPDPRRAEDDATTGEDFLRALLAPVRSGMILTRIDLSRAARELELGARMGERLYILKALLGQDPAATLGWLADEARAWTARHQAVSGFAPDVTAFWIARASATARLLDELAVVDVDMNDGGTDRE